MISFIRKLRLKSKRSHRHIHELGPLVKSHEETLKTKADPTIAMQELQPSVYYISYLSFTNLSPHLEDWLTYMLTGFKFLEMIKIL